jgi:putative NADPH-quinone reductase
MRALVIYCHPVETSFASAVHRSVIETLTEGGHAVTDLDLYAEGFRPVLNREEREEYSDPARYYQSVRKYARQLASVDAVVGIYPTWWFGMPAMLKGYFDRVWAPGVAYDVKAGHPDTARLGHINRLGVVTTYGASWWMIRLWMGDPERTLWSRGVRALCGRGCRLDWLAHYDMDRASQRDLDRFLAQVKRTFARW